MDLVVNFDQNPSSLPSGFVTDVNYVASLFDSLFTNNVTVTIDVGYGEVAGQSLGAGSISESDQINIAPISYSALRSALLAQGAPGASTLPATSPFGAFDSLQMGSAEQKALGLEANNNRLDGYVGFDSAPNLFSYAIGTAPPSGEYYFVGAVEHEMTEVMGRDSFLGDFFDYSAMDLYRYSAPGSRAESAYTSPSYFSVNNGLTNLDNWNNYTTGNFGDLGDWAPSAGNDAFDDVANSGVVNVISSADVTLMDALGWETAPGVIPNASPPAGTTADMILSDDNGNYDIYNLGANAVLAEYSLGQVGTAFAFVGLGDFSGNEPTDMMLRNSSTGVFELYDINNNNVQGAAALGAVGFEWQLAGFGTFGGTSTTDMMLRDTSSGAFEVYDIANNSLAGASNIGAVGSEWQVAGFGDFSGNVNETDMMLRNSSTGMFELYDIAGNRLLSATAIGAVGLEWQIAGFGDFSGNANETDMMLRNSSTGMFEVYDISHSALASASAIGSVGLSWQVVGFGPLNGTSTSDMVLENAGSLEVYDIANSQLAGAASLGTVGSGLQVDGIAANSLPSQALNASTAQLAQAMAALSPATAPSFASSLDQAPLNESSQLLAPASPQHQSG